MSRPALFKRYVTKFDVASVALRCCHARDGNTMVIESNVTEQSNETSGRLQASARFRRNLDACRSCRRHRSSDRDGDRSRLRRRVVAITAGLVWVAQVRLCGLPSLSVKGGVQH
jgi:hypothetical protein